MLINKNWNVNIYCFLFVMIFNPLICFSSPGAGTEIVNQATIKYTDANGLPGVSTTNIVVLVVQQVYSATIESDKSLFAAPGKTVIFHHSLKNTGNGSDLYCVNVANEAGDSGNFSNLKLVLDLNQNGQYDDEPILDITDTPAYGTLLLDAEEQKDFLVIGEIPDTAIADNTYNAILTVQAQENTGVCQTNRVTDITEGKGLDNLDDTNQDTVTITDQAVLVVTKSSEYRINTPETHEDDTIFYTVTVKNHGLADASDLTITDDLPTGTIYQASTITQTGTWDAGQPVHDGESPGKISGTTAILASNAVNSFSYEVDIDNTLEGGSQITNIASASGNLDGNTATDEPDVISNETVDEIPVHVGVIITDTGQGKSEGINDGGDDDGTPNDDQVVDTIFGGEKVLFKHIITNTGNSEDTFDILMDTDTFPIGTVFSFFNETGDVYLLDTEGNGLPDTGPVDPDESLTIMVKALLPKDISMDGPFTAIVKAISVNDLSVSDTTGERLETITDFKVDIANSNTADGYNDQGIVNADPHADVTTTKILTPDDNNTITFNLFIVNEGLGRDSYGLSAWADAACTISLPPGWQVIFQDTSGNIISYTPGVNSANEFIFTAQVLLPDNVAPGTYNIFFKAKSDSSKAVDIKQDAIVISENEQIALTHNQGGIVYPGLTKEYIHTLKNIGDTAEDVIISVKSQTHLSNILMIATGFSASEPVLFKNIANMSPGDQVAVYNEISGAWKLVPLVSDGGSGVAVPLLPGENAKIKVNVIAPTSAALGINDVLVLLAEVVDGTASDTNTDQTIVSESQLVIKKFGALDAICDGTPDTVFATDNVGAQPGQCVIWQILLNNTGNKTICSVTVYDSSPAFTHIFGTPVIFSEPLPGGSGTCIVDGDDIICTVGNTLDNNGDGINESFCLGAGENAEIRMNIKVE